MGFGVTVASNILYKIFNLILVFGTIVIISKITGPAGFGVISLLLVNAVFLNLATSLGTDSSVTYQLASVQLTINKIISFVFLIIICQALIAGISEIAVYYFKNHFWIYHTANINKWWIGIIYLVAISLNEKYTSLFNGKLWFSQANIVFAITNFIILLVFGFFLLSKKIYDISFYTTVYVLLTFLQSSILISTFHILSKEKFRFAILNRKDFKIFFSYSFIAFLANLLQFLAYRIDMWLINFYKNESALGLYSVSVRLAQFFWLIPLVFATVIFPKVSASKENYDHSQLRALIRITNTVNFIAFIFALVFAQWFIPFLFGDAYRGSVYAFLLLLPGIVVFCITTVLASWFAGMNLLRVNLTGSLLCFLIILILDFLLIPRYGIEGASIGSSIGYVMTTFYFIERYCHLSDCHFTQLLFARFDDWKQVRSIIQRFLTLRNENTLAG